VIWQAVFKFVHFCPRRGHNIDHSSPSRAYVKNEWRYSSPPSTCLHGMGRDGITFPLSAYWIFGTVCF